MANKFQPREQFAERHVVIPDMHGEDRVVEEILDRYSEGQYEDVAFVFLGDIVDRRGEGKEARKGVYRTIEHIHRLGSRAVVTMANHEWVMLNALYNQSFGYKEAAMDMWLGYSGTYRFEKNVLTSYGIDPSDYGKDVPRKLIQRFKSTGHIAVINNIAPYFETDKFIATHAGIHPVSDWEVQKDELERVANDMAHGLFFDQPRQWFDMGLAVYAGKYECTDKTVLSGHAHSLTHSKIRTPIPPDRSMNGGKRIRLASQLNEPINNNAFIWQDWDGQIVEIPNPRAAGES